VKEVVPFDQYFIQGLTSDRVSELCQLSKYSEWNTVLSEEIQFQVCCVLFGILGQWTHSETQQC
jgi:hypothetical protein